MHTKAEAQIQSNYNLKNVTVDLLPTVRATEGAVLSLRELESLRVDRRPVSASKFGLETICGASCETGAQ